jgi:ApbE superfamily uncharacterized protein (UPF0280 family)
VASATELEIPPLVAMMVAAATALKIPPMVAAATVPATAPMLGVILQAHAAWSHLNMLVNGAVAPRPAATW